MAEADLPWALRPPEAVDAGPDEVLYEDDLPLSDFLSAPSGAVCCLRRVPGLAEVIAWPELPSGRPESWTGGPTLPLLRIFGFDGLELYGCTESALLRIRPGHVQTVAETKAQLRRADLSPDRSRLFWIERSHESRLFTLSTRRGESPQELDTGESCIDALWLSGGDLLATQLHIRRGAEVGLSLVVWTPAGHVRERVLDTTKWLVSLLARARNPHTFFMAATRHDFGRSFVRRPRIGASPTVGTCLMRMAGRALTGECIGNASPAGGAVGAVDNTCIFADARQQGATRSVLIAASPTGVRSAEVPGFLRDFALAGAHLVYGGSGTRFTARRLPIGQLLP
jgi:hypothetical protein